MKIGGVLVHSGPEGGSGMGSALSNTYLSHAEFKSAGIYPVEILYYDKDRDAGIEVFSTLEPRGPQREVEKGKVLNLLQFMAKPSTKK